MKKYLSTILIVVGALAIVGFVVWAMTRPDSSNDPSKPKQELTQAEKDALKVGGTVGKADSAVVLTEFGDYQCPACGQWHPFIKDTIIPQYQDRILIVFKNFPLTQAHKNAQVSAQAAEAAALQGKFWEMHNMLYDHQADWSNLGDPKNKFEDYVRQLGLDIDQWKRDFDSDKVKNLIKADVALGDKLGLPGTPSFLINGGIVDTSKSGFNDLKNAIDQALAQTK